MPRFAKSHPSSLTHQDLQGRSHEHGLQYDWMFCSRMFSRRSIKSNFTLLWISNSLRVPSSGSRPVLPGHMSLLRMTSQAGVAVCPGSPCSSPSPLSGHLMLSHFLLHRPLSVGECLGVSALRPALSSLSAVSPRSSRVSLQSNQPSRRLTPLSAPSRGVLSGPSESCSLRSEPSHVVHHHCCCCCCRVGGLGTSTSKDLVSSSSATSTHFFG